MPWSSADATLRGMAIYQVIDPATGDAIGQVVSNVMVIWDPSTDDAHELKLVRVDE